MKKAREIELGLMVTSVLAVSGFVACMLVCPDKTTKYLQIIFEHLVSFIGPVLEVVFFISFILALYLAFGKYGKIRLGDEEPEYSLFSYITMMLLASLASAALYWSFTEWAYYYQSPGLGMLPSSKEALETSIGYQFFHWGATNQSIYTIMGVAIAYAVYVKKIPSFQISAVCTSMVRGTDKRKLVLGKIIDFCVIFGILGGLSSSLGLAVPLATGGLRKLFGTNDTHAVQIGVIVVITCVYVIMVLLGTNKGMKVVSNSAAILSVLFLAIVLFCGPTSFILKNIVNSFGFMTQNLIRMSLYTDPIRNTGFVENWTIYFEAFYLNYVAMMGIFIAKISKGRTIRQVAVATLFGISAGGWILFGINGSYSVNVFLEGASDVIGVINSGVGEYAIYEIVETLPFGSTILPVLILVLIIGYVAPSMDSASLALAQTVSKKEEPNIIVRLFWCVMLSLIPMCVILKDVSFNAIKQLSIIVSIPLALVLIVIEIGLLKWLKGEHNNFK